jgi:hypothetical protein
MRRFTVYYRFGQDYLPMANYSDIHGVGDFLNRDNTDGYAFKAFDNQENKWVDAARIFLACVLNKMNSHNKSINCAG